MEHRSITYRSSLFHYARYGHQGIPLLCFHGYGESSLAYDIPQLQLTDTHTLIAIDLPFHGKTVWNESQACTPADLLLVLQQILDQIYGSTAVKPLPILLGFSLGGRIALSLYQQQPDLFQKIVLLAPDGLKVNPWYRLATQTRAGNRFFRYTMQKPGWFFGILKAANKLRLVNSSVFKFVNHYIGDPQVRELLYLRWTGLRKFRPDLQKIRKMIRLHRMPVRLVFGRFDRIILPGPGERFINGLGDQCRIRIIRSGHQVLHADHAPAIREEILG